MAAVLDRMIATLCKSPHFSIKCYESKIILPVTMCENKQAVQDS